MNFRTFFSDEDDEWVGVCDKYPSLSWLADTPEEAERGIIKLVDAVEKDLRAEENGA